MLYQEKPLDLTVVVLSIDGEPSKIEKTYHSSKFLCEKYPCIGIIPKDRTTKTLSCPVFNGGDCVTSLIDIGMNHVKSEWAFFVFSGSIIKKKIDKKLSSYVESKQDVLFPVVNRIWNFIDGSMNGLLISKEFYNQVGEFGSGNTLQNTKILWAERALEKGVRFKAIVNACNY